eukprot:364539-Chlamydomonas_euryale.AAC.11
MHEVGLWAGCRHVQQERICSTPTWPEHLHPSLGGHTQPHGLNTSFPSLSQLSPGSECVLARVGEVLWGARARLKVW